MAAERTPEESMRLTLMLTLAVLAVAACDRSAAPIRDSSIPRGTALPPPGLQAPPPAR